MIEKVGVYCRLSDEDRFKTNKNDDSDSIVNQRSMCVKFAVNNGWDVVDIYSDDDFSGAGVDRPGFNKLIEDCESRKINLVLCKTQSRFSRDLEVIERYLHNKFIEWGVRFVSIVDNADTSNESNKKSRQINGLMNEWYLEDLSQNIKKSLKNKREDGLFMGSFAPYGYVRSSENKHKLIVDPVASKVVKEIFERYKNGEGYFKIAQYLNNNNIPTPSVYKKQSGSNFVCCNNNYKNPIWTIDTIAKLLRNEVYIGNLVQGKRTSLGYKVHKFRKVNEKDWCRTENTHDAVIDKETWNLVQKRLGTHESPTRTGEVHYFSKKVYCSDCGKVFTRNVFNTKSGKKAYLQCKGAKKLNICENNKSIKIGELEIIVINAINDLLNNYYDKDNLQEYYNNIKSNDKTIKETIDVLNKEKNNLDKKIAENKSYFRKLYEDKNNELITEDMFKMLTSDYSKEIDNMILRKNNIDNEIDCLNTKEDNRKQASDIFKKYKHIKKLDKLIIDEFIEKINIGAYNKETNSRDIEIEWNFEI